MLPPSKGMFNTASDVPFTKKFVMFLNSIMSMSLPLMKNAVRFSVVRFVPNVELRITCEIVAAVLSIVTLLLSTDSPSCVPSFGVTFTNQVSPTAVSLKEIISVLFEASILI